jgi:hypothetical protein
VPDVLIRLFRLYQLSFLGLLLALGLWLAHWGTALAMAARPAHPSGPTLAIPEPSGSPRPSERSGRKFAFQSGGQLGLAPAGLSGSDRYDYYASLAAHYGLRPVRTTVVGLRGLDPRGRRHPSGDNMSDYDDTFVVLAPESRQARELLGATHAGQAVSSLSPRGGVAQIHPGVYRAIPIGEFNSMPAWWVTTPSGDGHIPCWRDSNGNGFIDQVERGRAWLATEILFHNGRNDDYGTSIGCQVLPPAEMRRFIATVGEHVEFDYVLIDANRPVR